MSDKAKTFPPLTKLMDEGYQKEIDNEVRIWNTRTWKGTEMDRFPLSPSQIGKCSLALARNMAHYLGVASYPRLPTHISPRTKRIFDRGHLLESALIADMEKHAGLQIREQQTRLRLFPIIGATDGRWVEGNIDGLAIEERHGVKFLVDYKSKGAFYSAGFTDSISQFFTELKTTGCVVNLDETSFLITDAKKLFDLISLDEFFVDYLLQLNAYAFSNDKKEPLVDFVSLYYENKNTCANYEVRWEPRIELFEFAKKKFNYIYSQTLKGGPESVEKDFQLGSARCRLCEFNERCWGKYEPKANTGRVVGKLDATLDSALRAAQREHHVVAKIEEDVLTVMARQNFTHIQTTDGLIYERKYLKSPKEHFELRLSK